MKSSSAASNPNNRSSSGSSRSAGGNAPNAAAGSSGSLARKNHTGTNGTAGGNSVGKLVTAIESKQAALDRENELLNEIEAGTKRIKVMVRNNLAVFILVVGCCSFVIR
jgi:hypothetical protein